MYICIIHVKNVCVCWVKILLTTFLRNKNKTAVRCGVCMFQLKKIDKKKYSMNHHRYFIASGMCDAVKKSTTAPSFHQ